MPRQVPGTNGHERRILSASQQRYPRLPLTPNQRAIHQRQHGRSPANQKYVQLLQARDKAEREDLGGRPKSEPTGMANPVVASPRRPSQPSVPSLRVGETELCPQWGGVRLDQAQKPQSAQVGHAHLCMHSAKSRVNL